jgi:hypothetical protein
VWPAWLFAGKNFSRKNRRWEDIKMVRVTLMIVAMLIGLAPMAHAVTRQERMANLSKMMESVTDKTSKSNKEEAAKHMAMAKEAMAKNDESGCMAHAEAGLSMMHGD